MFQHGKEAPAMQAQCSDQNVAAMAPSHAEVEPQEELSAGNSLYQAATVVAILLFLISFWSC
jgi:hypothetical protein